MPTVTTSQWGSVYPPRRSDVTGRTVRTEGRDRGELSRDHPTVQVSRWLELYEYHDKYKFVGILQVRPSIHPPGRRIYPPGG